MTARLAAHRIALVILLVVLLLPLAAACTVFEGVRADQSARVATSDRVSPRLTADRVPSTTVLAGDNYQPKYNYLVNDREHVIKPVLREIPEPVNLDSILRALLDRRPSKEETDQHLVSAIPSDIQLVETRQQGDVITIVLSRTLGLNGNEASLAWAQLVYTATQQDPQGSVKIVVNRAEVDIRGSDSKSVKVATRADFRALESAPTSTTTSTTASTSPKSSTSSP